MCSTVNHFETFQPGRVKLTVGFDTDLITLRLLKIKIKNTITKSDFSTSLHFEIETEVKYRFKIITRYSFWSQIFA